MVRSRIVSPPGNTVEGTEDGATAREPLLGALVTRATASWERAVALVRPWLRRGSLTVGCLLALGGGCERAAPRVDLAGVVVDDVTGTPIAGARVETDDGARAQTDDGGRFALSVEEGDARTLTASAEGHATATDRVRARPGAPPVTIRLARRAGEDAEPFAGRRGAPPELSLADDAKLRVESCAGGHDEAAAEWGRSAMSVFVRHLSPEDPALRTECATCHTAGGFVAAHDGAGSSAHGAHPATITCGACHEPHADDGAFGLRVDDTSEPIAGVRVPHLGSGALCASCHRTTDDTVDAAPHAPQSDLLVGRGARTVAPLDDGAHLHIANTCARCHMTRPHESDLHRGAVGGHTFEVRGPDATVARSACAPCHGEVAPTSIGARDWNGDGVARPIDAEWAEAMSAARAEIRRRVARLDVHDQCDTTDEAFDVRDHDARVHLVDSEGRLLGDCDGDGRLGAGETAVTSRMLPASLAAASYDLLLLARDGSAGAHNPEYAFGILRGLSAGM